MGHSPPTERPPLAYSMDEAAEALRCSRSHVYELIARGKLQRVKIGRRSLVPAEEIERVLREGTE